MFLLKTYMMVSKPFLFFEYNDQCGDDRQTYSDDEGISPSPFEFRHSKIHTVPSCDQSQRQENRSDDCEDFHDVVLFNIDLRLVGLADLLDILLQMEHKLQKPISLST